MATYYLGFVLVWGDRLADVRLFLVVWFLAAAVAGPLLGAAGGAWSAGGAPNRRLDAAVLSGALLAEAGHRFVAIDGWNGFDPSGILAQVMLFDLVAVLVVPIVLADRGDRLRAYAAAVVLAVGGVVAITVLTGVARGSAFNA